MSCQTVLPKICGFYLSASIITLGSSTSTSWKGNYFENIQHTSFTCIFIWVRKLDLQRRRIEAAETSGWLHPLWPQNKWLYTPRTTDYRHTRHDRRIQTELAFTLAKNATKPNPFEIIPLQSTRKKKNWKTEEALARSVVTLETERIKGSNTWCCWWWWWTFWQFSGCFNTGG